MDRIPLSIFFNAGPRQDQDINHRNRWIPSEIDNFGLEMTKEYMEVRQDRLMLVYHANSSSHGVVIYLYKRALRSNPPVYLSLGDGGPILLVEPLVSEHDSFNTSDFVLTCLMVNSIDMAHYKNSHLRGTCFYVDLVADFSRREVDTLWNDCLDSSSARRLKLDLNFFCPLCVQKAHERGPVTSDLGNLQTVRRLSAPCTVQFSHGKMTKIYLPVLRVY